MNENEVKPKSVWNDISKTWGRIAGVIAAVGVAATFVTKVLHTSPEMTYSIFAALGILLLVISFYVDKQTLYLHEEILHYEGKARKDFTEAIHKDRELMMDIKKDTNDKIKQINDNVDKLLTLSKETRKDTVRIQLLMLISHQPQNVDTILKLAEMYFVKLKGDWYMTNEFGKWAKEHNVTVPANITKAMDDVEIES